MSYFFYISLDSDLKMLLGSTVILEELLTAFIESTMKQEKKPNTSYRLNITVSKLNNSVSPEREQKLNRLG